MSLIFLAAVIFNLAFSANVTNVRKLLSEEGDHDHRGRVTSGSCKGHCDKLIYCGMPSELAQIFIQSNKKKQRPQTPQRPGYGGMMGMPGMMRGPFFPGMMGMPFPYYGEEAQTDGAARRLLADVKVAECKNDRNGFNVACSKKPKCRGADTCEKVRKKGMCVFPALAQICCASCKACRDESAAPDALYTGVLATTGCRQVTKVQCLGDDAAKKMCAGTCSSGFEGVPCHTGCEDEPFPHTHLRLECAKQKFSKCGFGTKVSTCQKAAEKGWCQYPWMNRFCRKSCQACATCQSTKDICPTGFSRKYTERNSNTVTQENCCVDDDKVCSCEWECMFTDNCCEDFSERCCK